MRKRERSEHNHNQPAQRSTHRARHERVSVSSSFSRTSSCSSSVSNSVEIVPVAASGSTAENYATTSESRHPSTQPRSVMSADAPLDPHLERQMNALGLDDDFQASLRAMTPNTQREVLNDIVRNHQMEQLTAAAGDGGSFGAHVFGGDGEDAYHDSEESSADEVVAPLPGTGGGLDFLQMLLGGGPTPGVMPGVRAMAVDADGREHEVNPMLALLMQALMSGEGGGGRPQGLESLLQNLATEAQQVDAMRRMGMTQDLDDMSYEQLLELEERIGSVSKGLRPAEIADCVASLAARPAEGACPICLEGWAPSGDESRPSSTPSSVACEETAVELKHCHHVFHEACIRQWLQTSKQCPVCCQDVIEGTCNTAFTPS